MLFGYQLTFNSHSSERLGGGLGMYALCFTRAASGASLCWRPPVGYGGDNRLFVATGGLVQSVACAPAKGRGSGGNRWPARPWGSTAWGAPVACATLGRRGPEATGGLSPFLPRGVQATGGFRISGRRGSEATGCQCACGRRWGRRQRVARAAPRDKGFEAPVASNPAPCARSVWHP